MQRTLSKSIETPIGAITLFCEDNALTALRFGESSDISADAPLLSEAARQLEAYFKGKLKVFDLPLKPEGTPFQQSVWKALTAIPYGSTATYGEIAAAIGKPKACRAVGQANHVNPMPILIPCHRVIGANGALTGYAGGMKIKQFLLELEFGR